MILHCYEKVIRQRICVILDLIQVFTVCKKKQPEFFAR